MDPVQETSSQSSADLAYVAGRCAYCDAPLHTNVYFCLRCAMPYKDPPSVLTRVVPPPPSDALLIRANAPHAWGLFWTYLVVVLIIGIGGSMATGGHDPGSVMLMGSLAIFVVTCFFAARHWPSLSVQFRRLGFNKSQAWLGLAMLGPMLAVNYGLFQFMKQFAPVVDPSEGLQFSPAGVVMLFCALPAVLEEVAFRGLLQHWLQTALPPFKAIVLASALFAVLHLTVVSFPYLFCVGALLGWTKWKTDSLYPSMLIHFLHNLVVLLVF